MQAFLYFPQRSGIDLSGFDCEMSVYRHAHVRLVLRQYNDHFGINNKI